MNKKQKYIEIYKEIHLEIKKVIIRWLKKNAEEFSKYNWSGNRRLLNEVCTKEYFYWLLVKSKEELQLIKIQENTIWEQIKRSLRIINTRQIVISSNTINGVIQKNRFGWSGQIKKCFVTKISLQTSSIVRKFTNGVVPVFGTSIFYWRIDSLILYRVVGYWCIKRILWQEEEGCNADLE